MTQSRPQWGYFALPGLFNYRVTLKQAPHCGTFFRSGGTEKHVLKILSVIFVWRLPFPAPFVSTADADWTDPTVPCIHIHGLMHTRQRAVFFGTNSLGDGTRVFQGYFLNRFPRGVDFTPKE